MESIGPKLRELRTIQGLSLRRTASLAGISPAYLSRIESGKIGPPKPETLKSLTQVLGADSDAIFQLASGIDPEIVDLLDKNPKVIKLLRLIATNHLKYAEIERIIMYTRQYILNKRK